MLMGLKLNKGDHEIVLKYETPFLKAGAVLTLAGFLMLIAIVFIDVIKYRKNAQGGKEYANR